ncbi:MAG: phosphatase PAP2-related protein [Candidatus Pacebacteria bacterium]|nr:phosphatase PAP2-related protein [Candidatus Paceibacterota bacterium]
MQSYKKYLTDKSFLISLASGAVLLGLSLVAQFFINGYVTNASSSPVTDIILSNTRVYDVDGIFVWGAVLLAFIAVFVGVTHIKCMPFGLKSVAVFVLIRSVFVSLTHIGPFPTHVLISSTFFNREAFDGIFTGNDLFFSGHTGLPFLLALMFWDDKMLRYIFLGFSLILGTAVLLGHLHYSIDVLSAFFITYAIFDICKFLFKKDWARFKTE